MTDALESALEKMRKLAPEQQEELAELIEDYVNRTAGRTQPLTSHERELVLEGLADFEHGRVATKQEVEDAYKAYSKS
jgi:predicted transcriptional regulator